MASRRPLSPKTWFRSFPVGRLLALLLALGPLLTGPARADELVRQVQEELRKRSLYFGDVDGTLSSPTAAALRRYQQRKGFAATGEPDAVTLHSLMIPLPAALAAASPPAAAPSPRPPDAAAGFASLTAPEETRPWPDITILRSDEARRQPAPADSRLEAAASPGPNPARPVHPPPAAASRRRVTLDEARAFIERYLQAGQTNDPRAELAFYGEHVDYFNEGVVDHHFISGDITRYDHRWPERRFTLLEPFNIANSPDGDPDKTVVKFRYQFANKGSKYLVHGKTDNTWTLSGQTPADLQIISIQEERVPRTPPGFGAGVGQPTPVPAEPSAPR